jgi:MYXO-CTERM domain-containing protein
MAMRLVLALALALMATTAQGAILYEDWESGTDGWTDYGSGPYAALDNTQNTTPGGSWSLKTADTATNYTNSKDFVITGMTDTSWVAQWSFQHKAGTTREYVQLQNYSGGGGSGTLQQLISFGVYNSGVDTAKYNFRVVSGSVGWANTTIARSANQWHTMKVEQIDLGTGNATLNFYIDGAPAGTANTTVVLPLTRVRVGAGVGNASNGAYFDDISVTPEPASLALIALGGLLLRRRRMA